LRSGSKPNFLPDPGDVAAAAQESLPDGTVQDLIDVLCKLSADFGVDWEFSHDHDPGPIGFIRGGVCEPGLRDQLDAIAGLGDVMREMMDEIENQPGQLPSSSAGPPEDDDDDRDGGNSEASILPFRPRNG